MLFWFVLFLLVSHINVTSIVKIIGLKYFATLQIANSLNILLKGSDAEAKKEPEYLSKKKGKGAG